MTADWYPEGLEDDVRPRLFAASAQAQVCALATLVASRGGPRPTGSQMVVTADRAWGYLSGGCIEPDVILHARETIADGRTRRLIYGEGSPFLDLRLPCGGRLDVAVERVLPDDPRVGELAAASARRGTVTWSVDGGGEVAFIPSPRLLVIGGDPFALAMAQAGGALGWDVTLNLPVGPETPPPVSAAYSRAPTPRAIADLTPDGWTAIAVATHDLDIDHDALVAALGSAAGYVGVLGARRRMPERLDRLRAAGVDEARLVRLYAPLGLEIAAATPRETAVATLAEIIAVFRGGAAVR